MSQYYNKRTFIKYSAPCSQAPSQCEVIYSQHNGTKRPFLPSLHTTSHCSELQHSVQPDAKAATPDCPGTNPPQALSR